MLPAYKGIFVLALGLLLAAVLQAEGLRKQAEIQPAGFQREVAIDVTRPLVSFSRALHLTTPRHELQVAIGRGDEDRIDTRVHFTLPPPAGPLPRRPGKVPGTGPGSKKPRQPRTAGTVPGTGTGPKRPRPSKPLFTAAHPLRVWVGGDSLAEIPGEALQRVGGAIDVVGVESRLSTGLGRPDLYNWFTRIEQVPGQLHPKVAVLSFGADDAHDYLAGVPGGRSVGPLGSPSWDSEYERRVEGVTRELNAKGIYVVWLGLPNTDHHGFRESFPVVNGIIERVVRENARMSTFVDTWKLLSDKHGRYASYLRVNGQLTLMRLSDGTHYTAAAGDLIAKQVLRQLGAVYRIR
ncbi:MAG TPA: DUF459 domain-containing protein [Gaiellaceae bacterium]|nr:DUF459 domain-containing protein [Gaiellaceae bacterium]